MNRIQVSTTNTTTLLVSATSGGSAVPDGTSILVSCDFLSYSETAATTSGEASFTVPVASGRSDLELLDATVRVGTNPPVSLTFETQSDGGSFTSAITVSDETITVYGGTGGGVDDVDTAGNYLRSTGSWVLHTPTPFAPLDRRYSKNLDAVASAIVAGEASVLVLGDSINNPTQAEYMRTGYIAQWPVASWKGIAPAFSTGNGKDNLFTAVAATGANITGYATLNGPNPSDTDVAGTWAEGLMIQGGASILANKMSDGTGGNTTNNAADFELFRVTPVTTSKDRFIGRTDSDTIWEADDFTIRSVWYAVQACTIQARYRGGTFGDTIEVDHSLSAGWNIIDGAVGNSADGNNMQYSSWHSKMASGDEVQCTSVLAYSPSRHGMTMSYAGGGGWGVTNHRYADNTNAGAVPAADPPDGAPVWYTNDSIAKHMEACATNVVMIWLGQNDTLSDYEDNIAGIVDRFEAIRPGMSYLIVSTYDTSDTRTKFVGMANAARDLAGSDGYERVAFLDLNAMIFDKYGAWSTWKGDFLDSSESPNEVHPREDGSLVFADLMWHELAEVAGTSGKAYEYKSFSNDNTVEHWNLMVDIDTSGGDVTITVPPALSTGDQMVFVAHGGNAAKVKASNTTDKMNGKSAGTAIQATIANEDYLAIRVMTSGEMLVENAVTIAGS